MSGLLNQSFRKFVRLARHGLFDHRAAAPLSSLPRPEVEFFEFVESAVVPELLAIAGRMQDYENVFAWSFVLRKNFDPGALYSA